MFFGVYFQHTWLLSSESPGLGEVVKCLSYTYGTSRKFVTSSNHSQNLSRQKREKALICGFSKFRTQFLTSEFNFGARKFFLVFTFSTHGCYHPKSLGVKNLLNAFLNIKNICALQS